MKGNKPGAIEAWFHKRDSSLTPGRLETHFSCAKRYHMPTIATSLPKNGAFEDPPLPSCGVSVTHFSKSIGRYRTPV